MSEKITRYQLRVDLGITRQERFDTDPDQGWWRDTQERLSVQETLDLGALDFLGVTAVLARLHEAVTAMKAEHPG